jgi:hypothetical protein
MKDQKRGAKLTLSLKQELPLGLCVKSTKKGEDEENGKKLLENQILPECKRAGSLAKKIQTYRLWRV